MSIEHPKPVQWERVAAELCAVREAQQRTWGDLDNDLLGRYLSGEATTTEQSEVEAALEILPDLKLLTDLVRDVLVESGPAVPPAPITVHAPAVAARAPASLPLRPPVSFVRKSPWLSQQRVAVLAAACLFLALGLWMFQPFSTTSSAPDGVTTQGDPVASLNRNRVPAPFADSEKEPAALKFAFAPIENAVNKLEDPRTEGDREKRLDAAQQYWHVAEKHPDLERDPKVAPKLAKAWNRVGEIYQEEGDPNLAEHAFVKANDLGRKSLGEQHEATRQYTCNLAGVYQGAMIPPPGLGGINTGMMVRSAPPPGHEAKVNPVIEDPAAADKFARHGKDAAVAKFRERMNRPEVKKQVSDNIVPLFIRGIKVSPSSVERTRLALALGNLGPIARDAVPTLVDALRQAKEPQERYALIQALAHMGPPTADALPVVVRTMKECQTEPVRRSAAFYLLQTPAGKGQLQEIAAEGKADEKDLIREVLQRPRGGR